MKKIKKIKFILWILVLFLPVFSRAEIIFQDDFESEASDWECGDGQLLNWDDGWISCDSTVGFGYEWKMGQGHNSNNAVYSWKKSGVPNGYRSESQKWFSGTELSNDVYHRWYMKVPPASEYDKAIEHGFKFWRYITRENGYSNPPEVYLNVHDSSTFATSNLVTYDGENGYKTLVPISSFNDGAWHCHELHLKLNDNGLSNGIIEYWLDGVKMASHAGLNFGSVSDMQVYRMGVGIGNVSDSDWYQAEWSAIGFDDVVLSTEYVGPEGLDVIPPSRPTGLNIL